MAFARRETALSLISDLMGMVGLDVPTALVGNPENTVAQFLRLANSAGQQLMMEPYKWQELQTEFTLTTVPAQSTYDLPLDFDGFFADSNWNRTTRLPVLGALKPYEWEMLKARLVAGTTFTVLYRIINNQIEFYDTPTSVQTIVFPYNSRGWIRNAGDTERFDTIQDDTDVILFDPQMFRAKLNCMWRETKGFDTAKADKTLRRMIAAAQAIDVPGRTLSLAPGSDYPYLGQINVPDTGYGS